MNTTTLVRFDQTRKMLQSHKKSRVGAKRLSKYASEWGEVAVTSYSRIALYPSSVLRATSNRRAMDTSATAGPRTPAALVTLTPRSFSNATSMWSKPAPEWAKIFSPSPVKTIFGGGKTVYKSLNYLIADGTWEKYESVNKRERETDTLHKLRYSRGKLTGYIHNRSFGRK